MGFLQRLFLQKFISTNWMPVLFSIILLQIFSLKSIGMNLNLFQINNSSCTEGVSRKGSRFNTLNLCTIYTERWWFSLCDCPRLLNSNALNELERYTLKITKTIVIVIICPWRQKRLKSSYSFFFFFSPSGLCFLHNWTRLNEFCQQGCLNQSWVEEEGKCHWL